MDLEEYELRIKDFTWPRRSECSFEHKMREEELSSLYGELDVLSLGIFLLHKLMFMLWICINHLESEKSVTRMGFLSVLLLFV